MRIGRVRRRRTIAGSRRLLFEMDERDPEGSLLSLDVVKVASHGGHQFFQAIEAQDNLIHHRILH
jgi:hypothetical protein